MVFNLRLLRLTFSIFRFAWMRLGNFWISFLLLCRLDLLMCLVVLRKNFIDFFLLSQLLRLVLAHFLYIFIRTFLKIPISERGRWTPIIKNNHTASSCMTAWIIYPKSDSSKNNSGCIQPDHSQARAQPNENTNWMKDTVWKIVTNHGVI